MINILTLPTAWGHNLTSARGVLRSVWEISEKYPRNIRQLTDQFGQFIKILVSFFLVSSVKFDIFLVSSSKMLVSFSRFWSVFSYFFSRFLNTLNENYTGYSVTGSNSQNADTARKYLQNLSGSVPTATSEHRLKPMKIMCFLIKSLMKMSTQKFSQFLEKLYNLVSFQKNCTI